MIANVLVHPAAQSIGERRNRPYTQDRSPRRPRLFVHPRDIAVPNCSPCRWWWPKHARRSAIYLSRTPYEPSVGVELLAALRAMFGKDRTQITSEQVLQELLADPNSPWHEYRGRGPITKNQVAALLKDFEIRPVVVHPTKRADLSRHGYRAAQFEDAFARFLPPESNIRTLKRGGGEKT